LFGWLGLLVLLLPVGVVDGFAEVVVVEVRHAVDYAAVVGLVGG
jgi:hypothetical protein